MDSFKTGFGVDNATKSGFEMENENFALSFVAVYFDKTKITSRQFPYNWKKVMEIILKATENYHTLEDVKKKTKEALKHWMTTFQGWGLLAEVTRIEKRYYFELSLACANANWNEATSLQRKCLKL